MSSDITVSTISLSPADASSPNLKWVDDTRAGYNAVSLVCLMACLVMAVLRIQQFINAQVVNFSRILATCVYVFVLMFLITINVFSSGVGLNNHAICSGLIYCCLVFYGLIKLCLYLFMAERIHTVRSVELSRWQDRLWIATVSIELVGLATVIGVALALAGYSLESNGVCRVGIPNKTTIAILSFDVPLNLWLIGCFVWFLRPTLRSGLHDTTQMSTFTRMVVGAPLGGSATTSCHLSSAVVYLESALDTSQHVSTKMAATVTVSVASQLSESDDEIENNQPRLDCTLVPSQLVIAGEEESSKQRYLQPTNATLYDPDHLLKNESLSSTQHSQASSIRHEEPPPRRPSSAVDFLTMLNSSPSRQETCLHTSAHPSTVPTFQPQHHYPDTMSTITPPTPLIKRLDTLITRNLLGTLILFVPILVNAGLYWIFHGRELAWVCLVMCSLDVTASVCVLFWLGGGREEG